MKSFQKFGYIGATLMGLGVFCPLTSLPFVGSINYLGGGQGDGIFILIFAAAIALGTALRQSWLMIVGTGLALAVMSLTFLSFRTKASEMAVAADGDTMASIFALSMELQWGWVVLLAGVIAAGIGAVQLTQADGDAD